MANLFACAATLFDPTKPTLEHPVTLQVAVNPADKGKIDFTFADDKIPADSRTASFKLASAAPFDAASFSYDTLDKTVTLDIDLKNDPTAEQRFVESGVAGLNFQANAVLESVRIVLRPRPAGGDWSAQAPCFSILLCWSIEARAATQIKTTNNDTIAADASAEVELCAGFSAIFPNIGAIGLPGFQVRLDLPSFGLTSAWVPLAWFEIGDLSPFRFNGLVRWFGEIADIDWSTLPSFPLPDWNVDLPLEASLPLGIGVRRSELHLASPAAGKGLVVIAIAEGFYLAWSDTQLDLGGRVSLTYVEQPAPRYTFEATLFERQHPPAGQVAPYGFALPFEVLSLSADCWYFRLGLYASRVGGKTRTCFELLLEVGGLTVSSGFSDADKKGLYRSDLRLLVRDTTVLANSMAGQPNTPTFLQGATSMLGDAFAPYKAKAITVPALSFARDLLAPPPANTAPVNDYGLEFLDGDFQPGQRVFILWRQNGMRFLRALAHDLLGRAPAGKVGADEPATLFGLEIAQFAAGETQLRLDWRPDTWMPSVSGPNTGAPAPIASGACVLMAPGMASAVNLPLASHGVYLDATPADAMTIALPAISLEVARPRDQAIVVRREASGDTSVSHLMLFENQAAPGAPVPPIARARVGFSLKEASEDTREVTETEDDETFITVGVGYAGGQMTALRTIGWTSGRPPRFLQTLRADAPPLTALLPAKDPSPTTGDPGCPPAPIASALPVRLDFDAFDTPQFHDDAWRLSLKIAATDALFKLFGDGDDSNQSVKFQVKEICQTEDARALLIRTGLDFRIGSGDGAFKATGTVTFRFDIRDLALSVEHGAELAFKMPAARPAGTVPGWATEAPLPGKPADYWYSEDKPLLGLDMTALVARQSATETPPEQIDVLVLSIRDGRFMLALPEGRHLVVRYTKLGRDSLNFWVTRFAIGPGGVDLDADLLSSSLRVKGLSRPFMLEKASLRMRAGKLDYLSVDASGKLPELLNEAPVKLTIAFAQQAAGRAIELDEMHCELGDKDSPIFSRGTRFKFEIDTLGIQYASDAPGGERHFFFELSGSAQFTPDPDEFGGGLLEDLKSARIEFVRAPLSDEFHKSLKLVVELKRPVVFEIYKLFRMEIRSIGFEPNFKGFAEPGPAIIIGGQCEFARFGDVISADISFHAMRIGLPKRGDAMPQVHFNGLRVDISSPEGFRIAGRVDQYDTPTMKGFAGEGTVQIPGLPELSAAFSFVRLRRDETDSWKHAWFIAIEAAKISYQIGPLPIYLRQIGLGFGYRYTLPLIKTFEEPTSLGELLKRMMAALDSHQTLARIDSWPPDPGKGGRALWTIALEAVFSIATANPSPWDYRAQSEQKLKTLVAQFLAAFRSDFTLVAAAKIWYPVSVDDFFRDLEGMRKRPLASGFMIYSAPQSRFLAHAAKGADPYMGPKNDPVPEIVKDILRNSHFEATLLIEPGLIHAELGWPDRLMFGWKIASLELECRGGVLFRLERDVLIQGTFFSGRGSMNLGGGVDFGFVGVRVEAHVSVQFATRMLTAVYLSKPLDSKLYAAQSLDIAVRFSVAAWLRLKIGFVKININISFSFSLQLMVGLELGWAGQGDLGFRGRAQLMISVFGRSLSVQVAVSLNDHGVEGARAALQPYMGSLLEPGQAPPMPGFSQLGLGNEALPVSDVPFAEAGLDIAAALPAAAAELPKPGRRDELVSAHVQGRTLADGDTLWFVWIMPGPNEHSHFYPPTQHPQLDPQNPQNYVPWIPYASLDLSQLGAQRGTIYSYQWDEQTKQIGWKQIGDKADLFIHPHAEISLSDEAGEPLQDADAVFFLEKLIAGCWRPKQADDGEGKQHFFPEYWPAPAPELADVPPTMISKILTDRRVFDRQDPARGPNRRLDPTDPIDAMLAAMPSAAGQRADTEMDQLRVRLEEQARGNQSFLLQALHDDLVRLASETAITGGVPVSAPLSDDRPTLLDTGMVLCVKAKDRPAWIKTYDPDSEAYPILTFDHGPKASQPFLVRPAATFDMIDFAQNPPVFRDAITYFDEDTIAIAFDLGWGGDAPAVAKGARKDVEAYVRCYEFVFFDVESQVVIKTITSAPSLAHTKGMPSLPDVDAVRARYQYAVARSEIVPASDLAALRPRRIGISVTPVSQTGQRGACFTDVLTLEPKLTPLPADDAQLTLTMRESGAKPTAKLTWRQPVLPPTGGVARTEGWHLILRPLRAVPLGAYPEEATDVTDRGLMSATGQALIAGDIIIRLYDPDFDLNRATAAGYTRMLLTGQSLADGQRAAEEEHKLDLSTGIIPGDVFDHRGEAQDKGSPIYAAARSFFTQMSATAPGGYAWRLFLRATSASRNAKPDERSGVSGLAPVRLLLDLPRDGEDRTPLRPLQHFEWPVPHQLAQVAAADIRAVAGPVRVAVVTETGGLRFVQKPGRVRAVTVSWNSLPSEAAAPLPAEAYAAYDVFEQPLDNLINADLDKDSGFAPDWRRLRRVVPTDAILASQVPATMADVQNWEAQYPAFARSVAFLGQEVAPRDMTTEWPGWFSWAESELQWPLPTPFGDRIALPAPTQPALTPTPAQQLAIWRDLGRSISKMHLHEFLATLIGHVATAGGVGADVRFAVQLIAGQPVAVKDPIKWLAANTATLDPYGWTALNHLGLGVTLALRDPFTGLLLPQEETLAAIRTALAEVSTMAGKAGDPIAGDVNALRAHVLIDLPIQHLRAYRSDDSSPALRDVALNLVQISVRPLPLRRARYSVLTIEKLPAADGEVADVDITPATRLDLIFPRTERAAVSVDPAEGERLSLRRVFHKDDETRTIDGLEKTCQILVREFPHGAKTPDFRDKLHQAGVSFSITSVRYPLPLENPLPDRALSPFQKFPAEPELWKTWLVATPDPDVPKTPPTNYDLFLGYLEAAFKQPEDAPQAEQVDWHIALRRPEVERPLRESYMVWGARFFGTAPLGWVTHDHDPLASPDAYMAVAQPKTVDPLKIAADGLGRLFLTHFVEEEWATSRRYAIVPVGRYERLWASAKPAPTEEEAAEETSPYRLPDITLGAADVHLPRVRQLEPPKLLAARVVRSEDARSFHEITVAHPERSLSQSTVPVRNKLSFGEVRRKYVRRFRHESWKDRIAPALQGPQVGLPQPLPRTGAGVDTPHNLERTADTLLAVAPQARGDSTRYLAAAEPYYYEQTVSILATASHDIQSEQKVVVLPSPEPGPIRPLGAAPVTIADAAWTGPTQTIYEEWHTATDPVPPLAKAMLPDGFALSIRLPRLIESLDPVSHNSYFAYELARYQQGTKNYAPVGFLPDPDVRVAILDIDQGTATQIAQIAPRPDTPGAGDLSQFFELRPLSSDFTAAAATYAPVTDWADGIHAATTVRPAFEDLALTVGTALVPTVAVPTVLSAVDPAQLLPPDHLPSSRPLLQLAPLALRLTLTRTGNDTKIQQVAPLSGKRWLCRPHLRLNDPYAEPMTQDDLVVGLRLIVDVERRRAAALLGFDIDAAQDDTTRHGATGLLQRIEDSDIAILLNYKSVFEVSAEMLATWQKAGVLVWHREAAQAGATWSQVTQHQTSNDNWNLVTIRVTQAENAADQAAINQVVDDAITRLNAAFLPADRQIDRAKNETLSRQLGVLAALTFRSAGMRKPVAFVQRGNDPRVEWPRQ